MGCDEKKDDQSSLSEFLPGLRIELRSIGDLVPHEQVIETRIESRIEKLRGTGFYKPVVVDDHTSTILDGHHKTEASRRLGLERVVVMTVDYLMDQRVAVDVWPGCGRGQITKEEVLSMAGSRELFPSKTSRHVFTFKLPDLSIPLEDLR